MKDAPQPGERVTFGPFALDRSLGKLSKHGTPLRLGGMPLKILEHLVERPGEVVSRAELQKLLWNGAAFGDFEQGLNTAVNVVRKTLGDSADQARYIETVPGQGYRFIGPVRSTIETRPDSIAEAPASSKSPARGIQRWIGSAAVALALLCGVGWWTLRPEPQKLLDGSAPSANHEANDQYNLAYGFLAVKNDIPLARRTFERALELDPDFTAARLQRVLQVLIELLNGYRNDESILYEIEKDLHRVEPSLPASDGLLQAAQAGVYLSQGRLDRVPLALLEENWRRTGQNPTWMVILRMLQERQSEDTLSILRGWIERHPLDNPPRMFLGELLRVRGETTVAIHTLERVLQQGPGHPTAAWFLTMAYLDAGRPERSRGLLERMRPEFEKNYMWRHAWAMVLAAEGKHEAAREAMDEETLKFARLTWPVTSSTADFHALLGERSKAVEWLQLAISRGDERIGYFRRNPRLASLREDPRFRSMMESVEARHK